MQDSNQRSISNEELSFLRGLCAERTRANGLMLTCLSGTSVSQLPPVGPPSFHTHRLERSSPHFVPGALGLASCSRRRGSLSQGPGQLGCLQGRWKKYCARMERDPLGCTEGTTHRLGYSVPPCFSCDAVFFSIFSGVQGVADSGAFRPAPRDTGREMSLLWPAGSVRMRASAPWRVCFVYW